MPKPIIFYDIPCKVQGKAWSPNTWKTRYILNIKGLPYETVWVEFPDIAPLSKKLGAPPSARNRDGSPVYTAPFIYDPNTETFVTESAAIALYLDKTYPDTYQTIPEGTEALHAAFNHAFRSLLLGTDMLSIMIPAVHDALNPAAQPYFRQTREKLLGKLEDCAPAGSEKRAKHWQGVQKSFHTIAEWLKNGGTERQFFGGADRIYYADINVASFLAWIRAIYGEESKEWKDVLDWDGGRWGKFMDAMKKYEAVDAGTPAKL